MNYDGDQMVVDVTFALEAEVEACLLTFSHMYLQAIWHPISVPTQDMLIGLVLVIGYHHDICADG